MSNNNRKSDKQKEYDRSYRNFILFILGCMASMGSVLLYGSLIPEQLFYALGIIGPTMAVILLVGGFFTSVYFYRRTLID